MRSGMLFPSLWATLLAGLVLGVLFGAAVAGIILLVLGLRRRRPGLWIGGLVALIVSLVLLALGGMGLLTILA